MLLMPLAVVSSCEKMSGGDPRLSDLPLSNYYISTYADRVKGKPLSFVQKEVGRVNAIKKAYQLTDLKFTPVDTFEYNIGTYFPDIEYQGVPYSSVKELGTYVGSSVSFYTFVTAIRNPRSKLYTEKINEPPFHGSNCKAYYGTVCSSLVSYALGLNPSFGSYDFVDSDKLESIGYKDPEDLEVGDVLWTQSHVAIITDLLYSTKGIIEMVEVSEATQSGSTRARYNRKGFEKMIDSKYQMVLRYNCIEDNTEYVSCPEIVPVIDEEPVVISFNNQICVDKGDRSNYLEGEDVTLNIFSQYDSIVIVKDSIPYEFYTEPETGVSDITMTKMPYGSYSAQLWRDNSISETSWIVVDYHVTFDRKAQEICFTSKNAIPLSAKLCSITGSRGHSSKKLFCNLLTEEDILAGKISIPSEKILAQYEYVQVRFKTRYGIVSTRPIKSE